MDAKIRPARIEENIIACLSCSFPNLSITSGSSGIAWCDTRNHNTQFPFDFLTANDITIGNLITFPSSTATANVPGDPPQYIFIDLFCVDSTGTDIGPFNQDDFGNNIGLYRWVFTDGERGQFLSAGYQESSLSQCANPTMYCSGVRLQGFVQNVTAAIVLADPTLLFLQGLPRL